jgi:hypothetical protein
MALSLEFVAQPTVNDTNAAAKITFDLIMVLSKILNKK